MIRKGKTIFASITVFCFVLTQVLTPVSGFAAPATAPSQIEKTTEFLLNIPSDLGTVDHLSSGSGPTLVHIQTAHGHYEAQKKIQALLHHLRNQYGIQSLFIEGTAFQLDPEMIRFFPNHHEATMDVADRLAQKGLLKGHELFLLEAEDTKAYGIENIEAYRENVLAFRSVLEKKNRTEKSLQELNLQIERLASTYLSKALRAFIRKMDAFSFQQISHENWLLEIAKASKEYLMIDLEDPAFQLDWPILVRIMTLQRLEKELDLEVFEKEKDAFLNALRSIAPDLYSKIQTLLTTPHKQDILPEIMPRRLFEELVSALPETFPYENFPQIRVWTAHRILRSEIKVDLLMQEIHSLQNQILDTLAKTQKEKAVVAFTGQYHLLKKLLALELTADEYQLLLEEPNAYQPESLFRRCRALNDDQRVQDYEFDISFNELTDLFEKALHYYRTTRERDRWMLKNIEAKMREAKIEKAVVITGGFHAEPFRQYFQSKDYHYTSVIPKIHEVSGREAYLDVMMLRTPRHILLSNTMATSLSLDPKRLSEHVNDAWALSLFDQGFPEIAGALAQNPELIPDFLSSRVSRAWGVRQARLLQQQQGQRRIVLGFDDGFIGSRSRRPWTAYRVGPTGVAGIDTFSDTLPEAMIQQLTAEPDRTVATIRSESRIATSIPDASVENEIARDLFGSLIGVPDYEKFRALVQGKKTSDPLFKQVTMLLSETARVSLQIRKIPDGQIERMLKSILQIMTDSVTEDKSTSGIQVNTRKAYKPYEPNIAADQRRAQKEIERRIEEVDRRIRREVESEKLQWLGSVDDATLSKLEKQVQTWTQDGETKHIILMGSGLDASVPFLLRGIAREEDWNRMLRGAKRPQIHLLGSHDPAGVKRLAARIGKVKDGGTVRLLVAGEEQSADATFRSFQNHLPSNYELELVRNPFYNENTLALFAAGFFDRNPDKPTMIRGIHRAARQYQEQEWAPLSGEGAESLNAFAPYALATTQNRFARTSLGTSVMMLFSTVYGKFSNYLANLFNRRIGNVPYQYHATGEQGTDYMHSTLQAMMEAILAGTTDELMKISDRGSIGVNVMKATVQKDIPVSGPANPILKGFGLNTLLRLTAEDFESVLNIPRRPVTVTNLQINNFGDLGKLLQFAQIAATAAGYLAERDIHRDADALKELNQIYEGELEVIRHQAQSEDEALLEDETSFEEDQNILSMKKTAAGVVLEGVLGEEIVKNPALMTTFLGLMTSLTSSKGLQSVVKQIQSQTKLAHMDPNEVRKEIEVAKASAGRFASRDFKRVYAFLIGGSASGDPMLDALSSQLSDSPEVIWITSYDAQRMDRVLTDIGRHPDEVGFVVVSKSGNTFEVDANSATAIQKLEDALNVKYAAVLKDDQQRTPLQAISTEHIVFNTDSTTGSLRIRVRHHGLASIPHPVYIGGRFSSFSGVALFFYFLKGGQEEDLLQGLKLWDQWNTQSEVASKNMGELKLHGILENKDDEHNVAERLEAAYQAYEQIKDIPGMWLGMLDHLVNTISVDYRRNRELGLGWSASFKRLLESPFYSQLGGETISKKGIDYYRDSLDDLQEILAQWGRITSDSGHYISLLGEASAASGEDQELSRRERAQWNAFQKHLTAQKVPFRSLRFGPMNPSRWMTLLWIEYARSALNMQFFDFMGAVPEGQPGVEDLKRFFETDIRLIRGVLANAADKLSMDFNDETVFNLSRNVPAPSIPHHLRERLAEKSFDASKFQDLNPVIAAMSEALMRGRSETRLMGLATTKVLRTLENLPGSEDRKFLGDLIRDAVENDSSLKGKVAALYLDGKKSVYQPDASFHDAPFIVRASSTESIFNQYEGNVQGTSIGIYQKGAEDKLELKMTYQILWGSSLIVMVSDGKVRQDYVLRPEDNRLVEVEKRGEDNRMETSESGSYMAVGGRSNEMPPVFIEFLQNIVSPSITVKARDANVPVADVYQIDKKQGLQNGWMTRAAAYEYAWSRQASGATQITLTDKGVQHVIDMPLQESDLSDRTQIYVHGGAPKFVRAVQVYLDLLGMELNDPGRGPIFKVIEALQQIDPDPEKTHLAVRALAIAWIYDLRRSLDALPKKKLKKNIRELVEGIDQTTLELLRKLKHRDVIDALKSDYLKMDLTNRIADSENYVLLGSPNVHLRDSIQIMTGEEMIAVHGLMDAYERVRPASLLRTLKTNIEEKQVGTEGESVAHLLEPILGNMEEFYARQTKTRLEEDEIDIVPVEFGKEFENYLDDAREHVPRELKSFVDLRDIVMKKYLTEAYEKDMEIAEFSKHVAGTPTPTDDLQKAIIEELQRVEPGIFYEKDGTLYVRALRWIHDNLPPKKTTAVNVSGDVSDRLDHIYNTLLVYFARQVAAVEGMKIEMIVEEPLLGKKDVIAGIGHRIGESGEDRLLILVDPLDGTSQITEAGVYGSIVAFGFLRAGQTYKDFNSQVHGLGGFDLHIGYKKFINLFTRYAHDGQPHVVQFQSTNDQGEPLDSEQHSFRMTRVYKPLDVIEFYIEKENGGLGYIDDGLTPMPDPNKVIQFAIGGADTEFMDDNGHREWIWDRKKTYGFANSYTGGMLNDVDEVLAKVMYAVERIRAGAKAAAGAVKKAVMTILAVHHSYGETNSYQEGRYRESFENKAYDMLFRYLMAHVTNGYAPTFTIKLQKFDQKLGRELKPAEIHMVYSADNGWANKDELAWRYYFKNHTFTHPSKTPGRAQENLDLMETFKEWWIPANAKFVRNMVDQSRKAGAEKTPFEVRQAVFNLNGDITPLVVSVDTESAYKTLFEPAPDEAPTQFGHLPAFTRNLKIAIVGPLKRQENRSIAQTPVSIPAEATELSLASARLGLGRDTLQLPLSDSTMTSIQTAETFAKQLLRLSMVLPFQASAGTPGLSRAHLEALSEALGIELVSERFDEASRNTVTEEFVGAGERTRLSDELFAHLAGDVAVTSAARDVARTTPFEPEEISALADGRVVLYGYWLDQLFDHSDALFNLLSGLSRLQEENLTSPALVMMMNRHNFIQKAESVLTNVKSGLNRPERLIQVSALLHELKQGLLIEFKDPGTAQNLKAAIQSYVALQNGQFGITVLHDENVSIPGAMNMVLPQHLLRNRQDRAAALSAIPFGGLSLAVHIKDLLPEQLLDAVTAQLLKDIFPQAQFSFDGRTIIFQSLDDYVRALFTTQLLVSKSA